MSYLFTVDVCSYYAMYVVTFTCIPTLYRHNVQADMSCGETKKDCYVCFGVTP